MTKKRTRRVGGLRGGVRVHNIKPASRRMRGRSGLLTHIAEWCTRIRCIENLFFSNPAIHASNISCPSGFSFAS